MSSAPPPRPASSRAAVLGAALLGTAVLGAALSLASCGGDLAASERRPLVSTLPGMSPREAAAAKAAGARRAAEAAREAAVLLAGLSLEEKAGQVLLVGSRGRGVPAASSLALVESLGPGGILLFGANIPDRAVELAPQIGQLQDAASRSSAGLPLLVAVDHEGGAVYRFRGGLTRLPPPAEVGARGPAFAALLGRRAGLELAALGVNLALAPVVELLDAGNADFLGDRAYGSEPGLVDAAAGAFIEGLQSAGIAATAKHFPGNAAEDPHAALPLLAAGRAELERRYYPRFAAAAARGVSVVMLSHALVPAVDPDRPATLSPALVEGVLRSRLGFEGLILTDDLYMKAVADRAPPERSAVLALAAGADLLMLSAESAAPRVRDAIVRAVRAGSLPASRLDEACLRVLSLKLRLPLEGAFDAARRLERAAALPALVEESSRLVEESLAASKPRAGAGRGASFPRGAPGAGGALP